VDQNSRSDEQKSFLTKVAKNIHNYVKAQDDLLRTKEQFRRGHQDVKDLQEQIINIRRTIVASSAISERAQNVSTLLSCIQSFTFIFSIATDIGNYGYTGQFGEIARLIQSTTSSTSSTRSSSSKARSATSISPSGMPRTPSRT
jgi:hypothetical protein